MRRTVSLLGVLTSARLYHLLELNHRVFRLRRRILSTSVVSMHFMMLSTLTSLRMDVRESCRVHLTANLQGISSLVRSKVV